MSEPPNTEREQKVEQARAFLHGGVQGRCCDYFPECSHMIEAVTGERWAEPPSEPPNTEARRRRAFVRYEPKAELLAVRSAHDAVIRAGEEFEDALLAAAEAGASLRQIGDYASASASTVLRAIRRAEERRG